MLEIKNLFKYEIVRLRPNLLILDSVYNNLNQSNASATASRLSFHRINLLLLGKSLFYLTFREKMATLFNEKLDNIYKASTQTMLDNFLSDEAFWNKLERDYKDLINEARRNDIGVLIVEEPVKLTDYRGEGFILTDKKMEPVYRRASLLLKKIANDTGVDIVETFDYFNDFSGGELFWDNVHLTQLGNELLAGAIETRIPVVDSN